MGIFILPNACITVQLGCTVEIFTSSGPGWAAAFWQLHCCMCGRRMGCFFRRSSPEHYRGWEWAPTHCQPMIFPRGYLLKLRMLLSFYWKIIMGWPNQDPRAKLRPVDLFQVAHHEFYIQNVMWPTVTLMHSIVTVMLNNIAMDTSSQSIKKINCSKNSMFFFWSKPQSLHW